jgi:hypothetical protein
MLVVALPFGRAPVASLFDASIATSPIVHNPGSSGSSVTPGVERQLPRSRVQIGLHERDVTGEDRHCAFGLREATMWQIVTGATGDT